MTTVSKDILKDFGANLKKIRKGHGLTLVDLEITSGVSSADISRIESGKKNLSFTTLAKLAVGLDLPISEIVKF